KSKGAAGARTNSEGSRFLKIKGSMVRDGGHDCKTFPGLLRKNPLAHREGDQVHPSRADRMDLSGRQVHPWGHHQTHRRDREVYVRRERPAPEELLPGAREGTGRRV